MYNLNEISGGDNKIPEEITKVWVKIMDLVTVELMVLVVMK